MDGRLFVLLLLSGLFWSSSALSRQYHYINLRMSWSEAQSYCREKYTDLATVDSMDDVNKLLNITDAGNSGAVWIGLKRGTEQRWAWSNGEYAQYYNWASGEPNENLFCASSYEGAWHDMRCSDGRFFFCYTGNNGYIMVNIVKNWSGAQSYCRKNYIDLPTIHNSTENQQLANILYPGFYIWIGLFLDSWEWSDKWNRSFRHWAVGQPSQISGSDCVGMSRNNSGEWVHYSCDLKQPFICHGDETLIKRQIVRLKLSCNGKCTLNDPSLQTAILNEIGGKLKNMGLERDVKINWRKREGEEVFHEEIVRTASSSKNCNKK